MTANMDHERALSRLNIITEGKVIYLFLIYTFNSNKFTGKIQYSGCTISHGAMEGGFWRNTEELRITSIWAIHDPEGLYELGMADLNKESESSTGQFLEFYSLPFGKSTLKYGSEEKGSSLCRCSILLGFIMSKNLRGL